MECFFLNLKKEREVVISKREKGKKVHPTHKTKKILRRPTNPQKVCCVNFFQFLLVGGCQGVGRRKRRWVGASEKYNNNKNNNKKKNYQKTIKLIINLTNGDLPLNVQAMTRKHAQGQSYQ